MSVIDVAESFLHDCAEGESEFTSEVTNVIGENEFKELVELAKKGANINGETSDGYHTFNELYYHRMILFKVICQFRRTLAWKSKEHHDGTMYEDYFIVGVTTPEGDYTYHFHMDHWEEFRVVELARAPKWDGHEPKDVTRLLSLLN